MKDREFPFVPFRREDHVYHNEAFAELCKDAVRAFNGTPVCEMPPPRFAGSGVYAIYCTAKKGIYERYGNKVNRMGYNVPIYVGKAVSSSNGETAGFQSMSCREQLALWHKAIRETIGIAENDFAVRICECERLDEKLMDGVYDMLIDDFHPAWNEMFCRCHAADDILVRWSKIHSIRFRSRADKTVRDEMRKLLDVA